MSKRAEQSVDRWRGHPVASRLVRFSMIVLPFVTAMVVAYALSSLVPGVSSRPGTILRWVGIVAVATVSMRVAERCARRLLPLSTLLELTLVFPDQAPSRMSLAMRTGTTKHLQARIDAAREGRDGETPAEAAERLLELVGLLSHHDRLTRGHSERVRAYTHLLGTEMGLTASELDKIRWAGLLHDVGKTTISSEILNKPGKLTDAEFAAIKTHPEAGRELVAPLEGWLGESLRAVWEHHEKFDGTGYPRGLQGTEISIAARIVAVADVYDVITSARSYKQPLPAAEARQELIRCAGTHFDPIVVRAFLNISLGRLRLMAGPLAWLAQFTIFEPTGVVHAGNGGTTAATSSVGGGAAGAGSTAVPSAVVTAGTSGAAVASAGGASVASVFTSAAAVSMGLASGAAGMALAQPTPAPPDEVVAEVVVDEDAADRQDDSEVEEIRLTTQSGDASGLDEPAATSAAEPPGLAAASAGLEATTDPSPTPDVEDSDTADDSTPTTTIAPEAPTMLDSDDDVDDSESESGPPASTPSGVVPGPPATTPSGVVPGPPASTPSGVVPGPPASTPSGVVPGPPASTPSGNVPGPPATESALLAEWHFSDSPSSLLSVLGYTLSSSAPTGTVLGNPDPGRDDAPGILIQKDAAGIDGSDSTKVAQFLRVQSADQGRLKADASVDLTVAPKDFTGEQLVIEAGLWHCPLLKSCKQRGSGETVVTDATSWTAASIDLGKVNFTLSSGDTLFVRIAVLDDSDTDMWLAFGTVDHIGALRFVER